MYISFKIRYAMRSKCNCNNHVDILYNLTNDVATTQEELLALGQKKKIFIYRQHHFVLPLTNKSPQPVMVSAHTCSHSAPILLGKWKFRKIKCRKLVVNGISLSINFWGENWKLQCCPSKCVTPGTCMLCWCLQPAPASSNVPLPHTHMHNHNSQRDKNQISA